MMKTFIVIALSFFAFHNANAKKDCTIAMAVQVAEGTPADIVKTLEQKVREAVDRSEMEGSQKVAYFTITAKLQETSKEVMAGNRPIIAVSADLQLTVNNAYTGEGFAATTITISGAGRTENRAYFAALASVKGDNQQMQKFLNEAREKIENYYNKQMAKIIDQANMYVAKQDFEQAMFILASVPTCSKSYDKAKKAMLDIFQKYLDHDCSQKLLKAQTVWNATQDKEGAILAGAYLAAINPASICMDEVEKLSKKIKERVGEEWEFDKEKQRDAMEKEELRIKAIQTIGKAFGENQKGDTIVTTPSEDNKGNANDDSSQQN